MNDPHVEVLIYVVEHDKSSDYSLAKAIEIEHTHSISNLKIVKPASNSRNTIQLGNKRNRLSSHSYSIGN